MKTTFFAFLLTYCLFTNPSVSYSQSNNSTQQKMNYVILSTEKYNEIDAKQDLQNGDPITIKGYTKEELVAFYIQKYSKSKEIISSWVDFAFKKMHSFEESKPTAQQDIEFRKILDLPRTSENAYYFMMLMTVEQIKTVGY